MENLVYVEVFHSYSHISLNNDLNTYIPIFLCQVQIFNDASREFSTGNFIDANLAIGLVYHELKNYDLSKNNPSSKTVK